MKSRLRPLSRLFPRLWRTARRNTGRPDWRSPWGRRGRASSFPNCWGSRSRSLAGRSSAGGTPAPASSLRGSSWSRCWRSADWRATVWADPPPNSGRCCSRTSSGHLLLEETTPPAGEKKVKLTVSSSGEFEHHDVSCSHQNLNQRTSALLLRNSRRCSVSVALLLLLLLLLLHSLLPFVPPLRLLLRAELRWRGAEPLDGGGGRTRHVILLWGSSEDRPEMPF